MGDGGGAGGCGEQQEWGEGRGGLLCCTSVCWSATTVDEQAPFAHTSTPQVFKIYVLARVTSSMLRALPGMEKATAAAALLAARAAAAPSATAPAAAAGGATATLGKSRVASAAASSPSSVAPGAAAAGTGAATRPLSVTSRRAKSPAGRNRGDAAATAAEAVEQPPPELGPGDIPGDEVLGGSNVFGASEACLLCWLNVNLARVFPDRVSSC